METISAGQITSNSYQSIWFIRRGEITSSLQQRFVMIRSVKHCKQSVKVQNWHKYCISNLLLHCCLYPRRSSSRGCHIRRDQNSPQAFSPTNRRPCECVCPAFRLLCVYNNKSFMPHTKAALLPLGMRARSYGQVSKIPYVYDKPIISKQQSGTSQNPT